MDSVSKPKPPSLPAMSINWLQESFSWSGIRSVRLGGTPEHRQMRLPHDFFRLKDASSTIQRPFFQRKRNQLARGPRVAGSSKDLAVNNLRIVGERSRGDEALAIILQFNPCPRMESSQNLFQFMGLHNGLDCYHACSFLFSK